MGLSPAYPGSLAPMHLLSSPLGFWHDLLHLSSDLIIATAYVAISITLCRLRLSCAPCPAIPLDVYGLWGLYPRLRWDAPHPRGNPVRSR